MKLNLVKFSCGCIGFQPENGHSIIITDCDRSYDDNMIGFHTRKNNKGYIQLTEVECLSIQKQISDLISDGYRFRTIKGLLK